MRTSLLEALQLHTHMRTRPPPNAHAPQTCDELLSLFVLWVQNQVAEQRARVHPGPLEEQHACRQRSSY